ncbi:flagellar transcriptional regulator FlhD [Salmonella enterica]|nr:hypothetical protein [Salmonella enterica]EKC7220153.1 flagellar transcriptional regulator FlhD [Salmonella enterica]EKJ5692272.1 flagellar transcriptional regulator FlhD [Salmonella enterica]
MNSEKSLYELNAAWLMLAQKMLQNDRDVALFCLGLNARIAEVISSLTIAQIHQLAAHPHCLFTLRIQNPESLQRLLQDSRVNLLTPMHAAILCLSEEEGGSRGI